MSYLVLARKWRPQTFDEVVGQATVTRTLKNALASGRIGHAFLLSGARGVGKTTTARILAKALNCSKADGAHARALRRVRLLRGDRARARSLDVQEIDGATHNGVEQVRELRESARYNPARDRFKIWIIDEVHMLSTGAFNALLKTLEEPPPRVKFIFATTEYHKIPDTILSRCQQYDFRLIPAARAAGAPARRWRTARRSRSPTRRSARIARAAEGSARDALSLFDQVLSFSGRRGAATRTSPPCSASSTASCCWPPRARWRRATAWPLLELVERLSDYGADYRNFARELLLHFREILLLKLAPEGERAPGASSCPRSASGCGRWPRRSPRRTCCASFEVLTKAETDLRLAQDPRVTLELALLKLVQMRRLMPFAELVERVERLAAGVPPPAPARRRPPAPARSAPPPASRGAAAPAPRRPPRRARRPPPAAPAPADGRPTPPSSMACMASWPRRRGRRWPSPCAGAQARRGGRHARARGGARLRRPGRDARGRVPRAGPQGRRAGR